MSATAPQRIDASAATLGEGMPLRRALPTRQRRLIGAWCFLDHFGPSDVSSGKGMRVGPHPHIGLQTLTWLIDGEILHRDSLGTVQGIVPGQVNLMTAGRGISHSEESPVPRPRALHGLQFWIALPDAARHADPAFDHYPDVPVIDRDPLRITLFAGEWLGERSPARLYTPLVGADIAARGEAVRALPLREDFEHGALVVEGEATVEGERLAPGTLLVLPPGRASLALRTGVAPCRMVLVGGTPLAEPVLMWWNFVAREKDELTQAALDWNAAEPYLGEVRGYDGPRLVAPLPPWAASGEDVVSYP